MSDEQQEYLILFDNMLGVVAMRKHLTAAGQEYKVTDIPSVLGKACGLGIRLSAPLPFVTGLRGQPRVTEIFRCEQNDYQRLTDGETA